MKLDERIQVLKFCSVVFNSLFLILGLGIFGCAVWILFDEGNLLSVLSSVELQTVAGGLFVIGVVVSVVSVLGCVGAMAQNRFLLIMYMVFLIILVLGQLFITLILLINRGKIGESLDAEVEKIIINYGNSKSDRKDRLLDKVQHYAECCGKAGPADWLKNSFIQNVSLTDRGVLPCSCFKSSLCLVVPGYDSPFFGTGNDSYEKGCKEQISDWLEENALTVIAMDVSLILIQVLQFVLVVYVYRAVGQRARIKRTGHLMNPDPAYPDPDQDQPDPDYGLENLGYREHQEQDLVYPENYHDNQNPHLVHPEQNLDHFPPNQRHDQSQY
ncbi:CD82 antigen [Polymixia lowei]